MNKIILVTRCLKINSVNDSLRGKGEKNAASVYYHYQFHFHGFYLGHKIKKIILVDQQEKLFKKKDDYIILMEVIETTNEELWGKALKIKALKEIT